MKQPSIGQLRERVTIQSRVRNENAKGENRYTWQTLVVVYAKAEPLSGRELFLARQVVGELSVRFTIRYRAGLSETMRVLWRGEPYDIASPPIELGGMRMWIQLLCKRGTGDGQ